MASWASALGASQPKLVTGGEMVDLRIFVGHPIFQKTDMFHYFKMLFVFLFPKKTVTFLIISIYFLPIFFKPLGFAYGPFQNIQAARRRLLRWPGYCCRWRRRNCSSSVWSQESRKTKRIPKKKQKKNQIKYPSNFIFRNKAEIWCHSEASRSSSWLRSRPTRCKRQATTWWVASTYQRCSTKLWESMPQSGHVGAPSFGLHTLLRQCRTCFRKDFRVIPGCCKVLLVTVRSVSQAPFRVALLTSSMLYSSICISQLGWRPETCGYSDTLWIPLVMPNGHR